MSTTSSAVTSGKLSFLPPSTYICDHCNGLLLVGFGVINPATQQWSPLPSFSDTFTEYYGFKGEDYIVFDPTISPHYDELKWSPLRLITRAFSSATKRWEDRPFMGEGETEGTIGHLQKLPKYGEYSAVYWRGTLYVHHFCYVMLSLSDGKYQVMELLPTIDLCYYQSFYFGKSEKGVYLASFTYDYSLSVWILNESCDKAEWILKHQNGLKPLLPSWKYSQQVHGPWVLRDVNYNLYCEKVAERWFYNANGKDISLEENNKALFEDKFEWYSDNDDVVEAQGGGEHENHEISILGFHPYEEIVFLSLSLKIGLAYHLNSSNLQDIGHLYPKNYDQMME
uniref:F-box associated domain-containing protein n=1 Tax=Oryza punctata TaxID=4537 RepID=A0A0E0LNC8_ORYPU